MIILDEIEMDAFDAQYGLSLKKVGRFILNPFKRWLSGVLM
jgi:hypothetical protein